jgi:hypothetical protein
MSRVHYPAFLHDSPGGASSSRNTLSISALYYASFLRSNSLEGKVLLVAQGRAGEDYRLPQGMLLELLLGAANIHGSVENFRFDFAGTSVVILNLLAPRCMALAKISLPLSSGSLNG